MPRAPFQVLVLPFRETPEGLRYGLLKRSDGAYWQGIAGGGEGDERPEETARREAFEEGGIPPESRLIPLDTITSIPVMHFPEHHLWGSDTYVIPEYTFGIECNTDHFELSEEHTEYCWLPYSEALSLLHYDSNKTALWELNSRLLKR